MLLGLGEAQSQAEGEVGGRLRGGGQRVSGLISQDKEGNSIAEQNNTHMEIVF